MPVFEQMSSLEKKVTEVQSLQKILEDKSAEMDIAQKNYSKALGEFEHMKSELASTLDNIFPSNRVRVSA